ncbi:phage portal protein, partial [Listeria monocytogenes]|uniref:phage portal protein n=1 Tax=Listeria monocytogenes TaxID=1639 RepID=UPI002FDBDC6B
SATQGSRIQKNSANFFENMSRPSGMLTGPGVIDDATAERLKREWEKNYSGQNIGRLAVLGDGLTYAPMTIAPEAAQLIEQLKWTVEDV